MKLLPLSLVGVLASTAWAEEPLPPPPAGDGSGSATPAPPAPDAPPAPEPTPVNHLPPPVVVTPPPPPPAPAAIPAPPPVSVTVTTTTPPPPQADKPFVDDYYDRKRGIGMFHKSRLTVGVLTGKAPNFMEDAPPTVMGEEKDVTQGQLAFEGVYLGLPSAYGHFHGIEFSTGIRTTPIDFWAQFGTAVSLFNIGRGGPGSLRIGGSFGAGFNLAHGYGYVRGRAAMVLIPAQLDIEASALWMPSSASTGNYDELLYRASVWYRPGGPGGSKRAYEVYGEMYQRTDDAADQKREFVGIGAGVGMTLF
ncbi:MAG: hypothetical protein H0T46_32225 [Deltaproteobacteria bacterium]|nr:hypothetical protein [Deltaproteobacteria bacterium]